jgi:predicted oxidoreductase
MASVDHSLTLMGIDHIDLLLIHRPDPLMDHFETGAALDAVVASGKVRAIGVSNFKPYDWDLLQSAMTQKLVTNQIEVSVLAHSALTNGDIAFHQRIATPLMAWSPLAGGALFADDHKAVHTVLQQIADAQSVDVSAVAVAWLLAHPAQILPVMGTNSIERIKALSQATDVTLSRAAWYEIYTAALGREVA